MSESHVPYRIEGHLAIITLNRPEAKIRAVYQAQMSTLRSHLDYISSQLALLSETEDHQEAARAFLEKRKPRFVGK
jgi:enoyl-CoA hydratase/carnithine racemase